MTRWRELDGAYPVPSRWPRQDGQAWRPDRAASAVGKAACGLDPLRVIILTPGVGGLGGISRMMDNVAEELGTRSAAGVSARFVSTRGDIAVLRPLVFLQAILRVAFSCAARRCDVVHVNVASFGSTFRKLVLSTIAAVCGTPYVIHLHGAQYDEFWASRGRIGKAAINGFFRRAARIIVLGKAWDGFVRRQVPEAAERIVILPNATRTPDVSRIGKNGGDILIAFLGRLGARKGVPQLVSALAGLPSEDHWRAVLAGDGDVEGTRALIASLGLAGRVDVPGWVGPAKVEEILREADIFALPSFAENLPMSIVEAFAYGVPVVCTPVGSVAEMVEDGRTGLIVPTGDSAALARALRSLIVDADLRRRLARNAQAVHDTRYRLSSYTDRLVSLWQVAARVKG